VAVETDDRHYGHVVIVEDKHGHACRTLATLQPGPDDMPDPDDPATAGCLLALLGVGYAVATSKDEWVSIGSWPTLVGEGPSVGRACIAAAEALGRWPGGES